MPPTPRKPEPRTCRFPVGTDGWCDQPATVILTTGPTELPLCSQHAARLLTATA